MAGPKPRNRDGWEDCQGPGAFHVEILGSNQGLSWRACGARPSAGGSELGWPSGESPGITRKAVFSEGRGLRVRIAGPYGSRGIARSSGANEYMVAEWGHAPARPISPLRACGARPSAGGKPQREALGENSGITRRVIFSEGRTLCARIVWPYVCR
jgi:hypothetical protein